MLLYLVFYFAKGNGSRHIRRPAHILSAGIHKKHPFRRERLMALFRSLIMHHRRAVLVCADRRERKIQKAFRIPAQVIQVPCRGQFRYFYLSYILFQPVNKFDHCRAVFSVHFLHSGQFRLVLDRLHSFRRIISGHMPCPGGNNFKQRIIAVSLIQEHFPFIIIFFQKIRNFIIIPAYDAVLLRVFFKRFRHCRLLGKKVDLFLRQKTIG